MRTSSAPACTCPIFPHTAADQPLEQMPALARVQPSRPGKAAARDSEAWVAWTRIESEGSRSAPATPARGSGSAPPNARTLASRPGERGGSGARALATSRMQAWSAWRADLPPASRGRGFTSLRASQQRRPLLSDTSEKDNSRTHPALPLAWASSHLGPRQRDARSGRFAGASAASRESPADRVPCGRPRPAADTTATTCRPSRSPCRARPRGMPIVARHYRRG